MFLTIYFILMLLKVIKAKTELKNCDARVLTSIISDEIVAEFENCEKTKRRAKNCILQITTLPMNYLHLKFSEFSVDGLMPDCASNYLEIMIGCINPASIGFFCGKGESQIPHEIFSYDHCMTLIFHTDGGKVEKQWFIAEYITIGRISGVALPFEQIKSDFTYISMDISSGVFSSYSWPQRYLSRKTFQQKWVINIKDGYAVKLSFMDFHLPVAKNKSCADKGVLVITGDSGDTEVFCGARKPFYITVRRTKQLNITFMVNGDAVVDRGFILGHVQFPDVKSYHQPISFWTRLMLIIVFVLGGLVPSLSVSLVSWIISRKTTNNQKIRQSRKRQRILQVDNDI